jgi:hypothetical protein
MRSDQVVSRFGIAFSLLLLFSPAPVAAAPRGGSTPLAGVRLPFIPNEGQVDARVAYYAPSPAGTLYVTRDGQLVYSLQSAATPTDRRGRSSRSRGWTLTETFVGGEARPMGREPGPTRLALFIGSDPTRWRPEIPTYERVGLGEVWPGVTVALHGRGKNVEKVFTVHPGSSADRIRLRVDGARTLAVDGQGALVIDTGEGPVTFTPPVAYQERAGVRRDVQVAYRSEGATYGFTVGAHDPRLPLVIDPFLQSTYLGGTSFDQVFINTVHPLNGDVYVGGITGSPNFPGVTGGAQSTGDFGNNNQLGGVAFVARLSPDLKILRQATFLGGSGGDYVEALVVHPTTGEVYAAGLTFSNDFPHTAGGAQPTYAGGVQDGDGFLARLSADLKTLFQSTYLGGSQYDEVSSFLIDGSDLYVTGVTASTDFPGTASGVQPANHGGQDAFVARLPQTLTSLTRATYLGGSGDDLGIDVKLHPFTGELYVTGFTLSANFPGTAGGAQSALKGNSDAFVARLPRSLVTLSQATFLGGSGDDSGIAATIDAGGDVIAAGNTNSTDFPSTSTGAQPTYGGGTRDGFLARLSATLTTLTRATYLGGNGLEGVVFMARSPVDGSLYVTGSTTSTNFPGTTGAPQDSLKGTRDVYVARLSGALVGPIRATYLGGTGLENSGGISIHPNGQVYVSGYTRSVDFPQTAGGAQPQFGGGVIDGFVTALVFEDSVNAIPALSPVAQAAFATVVLLTGWFVLNRRRVGRAS